MLSSPRDVVVGALDIECVADFLAMFGFERRSAGTIPGYAAARLYGLDGDAEEVLLTVPGVDDGRIRIVATPNPPHRRAPFDERPFAIDLFSTDIEKSVALAASSGYDCSPITDHHLGPVTIREVEVIGPDRLVVTLLQNDAGRMSSILDSQPDRLHSEVHAFVWNGIDLDPQLQYWQQRGLQKLTDVILETPGLGALVGVPDEDVLLRLTVLADDQARPIRLEYVEFLGKPSNAKPGLPLTAGLHAPAFEVPSLDDALSDLAPAEVRETVDLDTAIHPRSKAAAAVTPGGQVFELWQRL